MIQNIPLWNSNVLIIFQFTPEPPSIKWFRCELKYYTLINKMIPEDLAELNAVWRGQR
jgi:hypothetical protein